MALVHLRKINGALYPADDMDKAVVDKWPTGEFLKADVVRPRNYKFHRKFFAMINVGYEAWEPPELLYKGLKAEKNPDRFRADCIVQAGFYDVVANLNGEVRVEPKSIAFGKMEEDEFEKVYSAVANVILRKVLTTYTRDDLDKVVDQIMGF